MKCLFGKSLVDRDDNTGLYLELDCTGLNMNLQKEMSAKQMKKERLENSRSKRRFYFICKYDMTDNCCPIKIWSYYSIPIYLINNALLSTYSLTPFCFNNNLRLNMKEKCISWCVYLAWHLHKIKKLCAFANPHFKVKVKVSVLFI